MKCLDDALIHLWTRWQKEYILDLKDIHRYKNRRKTSQSHISVRDIVIVHDESLPHSFWKLARVEKLMTGNDRRIRAATLRLSTGQGTLNRPIQLLYPFEVYESEDNDGIINSNTDKEIAHDIPGDASVSGSHSPTYQNHCPNVPQNKSPGSSNNQCPSHRAAVQARDKIHVLAVTVIWTIKISPTVLLSVCVYADLCNLLVTHVFTVCHC